MDPVATGYYSGRLIFHLFLIQNNQKSFLFLIQALLALIHQIFSTGVNCPKIVGLAAKERRRIHLLF